MRHVFWLREGVIGGRSGPNRNPWSPGQLADAGFGAVLSVNGGELVHPENLFRMGIAHRCIPLSDAAPPRPGDLGICMYALPKALEFVLDARESGRAVLVHCTSGKDRTGMFLSYYLCVTEGMTPTQAVAEVRRVRPIALSAEGWEEFTLKVLQAAASD